MRVRLPLLPPTVETNQWKMSPHINEKGHATIASKGRKAATLSEPSWRRHDRTVAPLHAQKRMPQELGLETHVGLFDAEEQPDHVLAMGKWGEMRRRRCSTFGRRSAITTHLRTRSHTSLRHSAGGR